MLNSRMGPMDNTSQYIGEPAITSDGDLKKQGGDYERVYGLNNEILILYGTDAGYWGNLIEGENSQIPGGMEELDGEPINSDFLERHAARAEAVLQTMITNGDAKAIRAESFNPQADRIEAEIQIELSDGCTYFFDTEECTGRFQ